MFIDFALETSYSSFRSATFVSLLKELVNFLETNDGIISIQPQGVDSSGKFELKRTIIGNGVGNWTVAATIVNAH
jgi:hypothetical protein